MSFGLRQLSDPGPLLTRPRGPLDVVIRPRLAPVECLGSLQTVWLLGRSFEKLPGAHKGKAKRAALFGPHAPFPLCQSRERRAPRDGRASEEGCRPSAVRLPSCQAAPNLRARALHIKRQILQKEKPAGGFRIPERCSAFGQRRVYPLNHFGFATPRAGA